MYKSNRRLIDILIVVFISTFVGILAGASYIYSENNKIKNDNVKISEINEIDKMYNTILSNYYGEIDKKKLAEAAIAGMLSILDKNTTYMDPVSTNNFNKKITGEYYGIGVEVLGVEEGLLVVSVIKDSPASDSGIKENDIIKELNGELLDYQSASSFTNIVENSTEELKLKINRNGRDLNISVMPEKVVLQSVTSNIYKTDGKNVGYIKISIFAMNTATQFANKLKEIENEGIDALIIDVRNNTGGYLSNAASILEMFMKKDEVLYKTKSNNSIMTRKDETDEYRDYPVAILVNGASASASEVLTACFMENHNSKIIGTKTYGKGTIQETINLLDNSMAKITTKKWLTPNENWIDEVGITPTIVVDLSQTYINNPIVGNDNQLETALKEVIKK